MNMHDVDRVAEVLDRRFGGAGGSLLSLLRIGIWLVLGLLLIGAIWPAPPVELASNKYNEVLNNRWVRDVTLDRHDTRGFTKTDDGEAFTIAWVDGSSIQSISDERYTFVPADLREILPTIDGRPLAVDMYFMSGARVQDLYVATAQAMADDADMVIVVLNPIWVFNDAAVQGWDNLDSIALQQLASNPGDWPLLAAFASPQDVAVSIVSPWLPAIRDRWSYAPLLKESMSRFDLLEMPKPEEGGPEAINELTRISEMTLPLEFWSIYHPIVDPSESVPVRQLALLERSRLDGSTINDLVISRMLDSLAKSGKPAYVYVPPIAPEVLEGDDTNQALAGIERHLAQVAAAHRSPNLRVDPETLARRVGPMEFNDIVHISEVGPLADYLANTICDQLLESGDVVVCEPQKASAP